MSLVPPLGADKPAGMEPDAARIWDRLAPLVPNLQDGHELILEDFCICLARLRAERKLLHEEGTVIEGTKGGKVKNPRMQAVRELRQAIQRYASDFGMTPAAAFRLAGGQARTQDAGEGLLDGEWRPDDRLN